MNVHLVRLVSDAEIMAEFIQEDVYGIEVRNPMYVTESTGESGATYMVLQTYVPYKPNPVVRFQREHVLDHHKVHEIIAQYYELSLIIARKYDANKLLEIDQVNQNMFDHLSSKKVSNTGFTHKGSDQLH